MEPTKNIGLTDLLEQVRTEIDHAQENLRASGKAPLLDLASAEVELSFAVTKTIGADGKATLHIFALGADAHYESQKVHRLKLTLQPHKKSGIRLDESGGIMVAEAHFDLPNLPEKY